jgi:hypothetical protein
MLGKTRGPLVGCGRTPAIGPGLAPGFPHTIHMSADPATLGEPVRCAPFHRHYYYWDTKKTFRDRRWAR